MATIRQSLFATLAGCLALAGISVPALCAQSAPAAPAANAALPLKAVLVLTPEFCATKFKQGSMWTTGRETFPVGKMACTELAPALKPAFADLATASAPPAPGSAQLVLIPKFVTGHATTTVFVFSNREMDVFLEWTIKDAAGKTVWLQTIQGTSKHHTGNAFTHGHDIKLLARDSVKDAAARSAAAMEAAPELRKLAAENASSAQ
jgi:hypothetical protein